MTPDPTPKLQAQRWENAKQLTLAFKQYCLDNEYAFVLSDDELTLVPSQIVISEDEINLVHGRTSFNLYVNDVDMDHGVHDTTEDWYNNCSLFNSRLIKLIPENSFSNRFKIESDSIIDKSTI